MGELEDALAAKRVQDDEIRQRREAGEREAARLGAELAKEFIATAEPLGIKPNKVLEHVTFYYDEHPSPSSRYPDRTRGKDISRVEAGRCWDIYGYFLTTDGYRAVQTYSRSEPRRRIFGKKYSIAEEGWELRPVLSSYSGYVDDNYMTLKDMMVRYIEQHRAR